MKPGPKHSRVVKLIVSPGRYVIGNNVDHAVSEGKTKKRFSKSSGIPEPLVVTKQKYIYF